MISAELLFVATFGGFALLVFVRIFNAGRKARKSDELQNITDNVDEANKVRDRLNNDGEYRGRMRNKYKR